MAPDARTDWLANRRRGIGGSDVAAVLGIDPYKSPVELWMEKTGQLGDDVQSDAMRRGHFLETAVADRYASLIAVDSIERQVAHDDGGIRLGNQDLRVIDKGGRRHCVEIKTVRRSVLRTEWGTPWSDEVPDRALCQGLWYGNLDNADVIDFAVVALPEDPDKVIGRTAEEVVAVSDFHLFQVARNPRLEGEIIAKVSGWWTAYVVAMTPPPPRTAEDVSLLWASHVDGETKVADPQLLAMLHEYDRISEESRRIAADREALRDRLLVAAGPAEAFVDADGKTPLLTLKTQERKAYEVKASSSRVLRFSKWWKKMQEATQ